MIKEMTIEEYKAFICEDLRYRCRRDREKYFPVDVMTNLLVGQSYNNELLTVANYNKLVTYYRSVVATYEPQIMALKTKQEIDSFYSQIILPDEKKIIEYITAV